MLQLFVVVVVLAASLVSTAEGCADDKWCDMRPGRCCKNGLHCLKYCGRLLSADEPNYGCGPRNHFCAEHDVCIGGHCMPDYVLRLL